MYPSLAYLTASRWTFVTSGQVASIARSLPGAGLLADLGRDAMGAVEEGRPLGDLRDRLDEDHAPAPEPLDDVLVVDDLVIDVDRGPEEVERALQALDRHVHPGAEASGIRQDDLHRGINLRSSCVILRLLRPYGKRFAPRGKPYRAEIPRA